MHTQGKRPLGKVTSIREDTNEMDHNETRREGVDWIQLAQERVQWRALFNTQ